MQYLVKIQCREISRDNNLPWYREKLHKDM